MNDSRTYELTAKKKDFPDWYAQIVEAAGLIDRKYDLKGMFVWLGYGYKAMNLIKHYWDLLFQNAGIQELYFPLIVPQQYCEKNESWWQGFKEEGYKVIAGQNNELQGALRPTGEPAMYPMFAQWVKNKTDLPIRIYETVSSFRFETKQTRPLIRDREITVWHEIHTAHATKEESMEEMQLHREFYDQIWNHLALAPLRVNKPMWECFPGAVGAIEYYSFIAETGRVMENGSLNNLGQAYAKKFDIKYADEKGKEQYAWQICTGNGGRLLAAVITTHGDDKGLIFPPTIAPYQVVIVPILIKGKEKHVLAKGEALTQQLKEEGIRVHFDTREIAPGRKFFDWEIKGVPVRVEIGPKDIENKQVIAVRRDTQEKKAIAEEKISKEIKNMFSQMQKDMKERAQKKFDYAITDVKTLDEMKKSIHENKIARIFWCENEKCYDKICKVEEGFEGFGTDLEMKQKGKCASCGKEAKAKLYIARTY